jgi:hypothetical protein
MALDGAWNHVNWEAFGREAERVGLHYIEGVGLIPLDDWRAIEPFFK